MDTNKWFNTVSNQRRSGTPTPIRVAKHLKQERNKLEMKTKWFTLLVLFVGLAVAVAGCGSSAAKASPAVAPESVVKDFYQWYLGYSGNVMVDGAYRSSAHLTQEFIQKVDEIIASFDRGGYDPFLCAQDRPGGQSFDQALVSGDTARVVVHNIWNPDTEYEISTDVTVDLQKVDGEWKISDIICR